jgi:predicted nucleotidyltransferase
MGYYVIINGSVLTSENREILEKFYGEAFELPEDYVQDKYTAVEGKLVLNSNWFNNIRLNEILERLNAIDQKSIRAIRANDTEYIQIYEEEAESLREELRSLYGNN